MFLATAFYASAQYQEYYITEEVGQEHPSLYSVKIDWKNNFFFIEGDGANDGPIKNLKDKAYDVVFVSDGDDKYTISMTISGYTMTFKTTTKKPVGSGGGGDRIQSMKESIGQGLNKGLDALKKKQEENKAKKEPKKQEKTDAQ